MTSPFTLSRPVSLLLSLFVFVILFSVATQARAEETSADASVSAEARVTPQTRPLPAVRQTAVDAFKEKQRALQQEIKDKRAAVEAEVRAKRAELASTSERVRGEIKENRLDRKEATKERIASTTEARQATMEKRVEEKRAAMKEREDARRQELRSRLAEKGHAQYERILKRLLAAVERLSSISERIDSRIAKLTAENIDMTTALALQVTAKAAVAKAEADVQAIPAPTFPDTTDASTTPAMINDALKTTREAVKKAEDSIQTARRALTAVVEEIKKKGGARADVETSADTSSAQ